MIKDRVGAACRDSHDATEEAPDMMAKTNARHSIRKTDQTVHLVPRVTREPLIGSLTSQGDLESLLDAPRARASGWPPTPCR